VKLFNSTILPLFPYQSFVYQYMVEFVSPFTLLSAVQQDKTSTRSINLLLHKYDGQFGWNRTHTLALITHTSMSLCLLILWPGNNRLV